MMEKGQTDFFSMAEKLCHRNHYNMDFDPMHNSDAQLMMVKALCAAHLNQFQCP